MARIRQQRVAAGIVVFLLTIPTVIAVQAGAQGPKSQQIPTTTWTITPNSLAGVGAYFAAARIPTPASGQSTENKWQHGLVFRFTGASAPFGIVSLDTDGSTKYATLSLNDGAGNVTQERFAFDWVADRFYFPFVVMLPGSAVAGFVYDVDAKAFTFIAALRAQAGWGSISGVVATLVRWYGAQPDDCAAYPRTDTFWSVPFGFVAGDPNPHQGTGGVDIVVPGDCPASVTDEPDAATFRHYVSGSLNGPATTTSSTSTSSSSTSTSSSSTSSSSSTTTSTLLPITTTSIAVPTSIPG